MRFLTKILTAATLAVFASPAHADIASVNYVHKYVTKVWNITVPTTAADSNVVSMKYLMSLVDAANEKINGMPTTDYAADPSRATSNIASTTAARDAIDELIEKVDWKFFFTPATTANWYFFSISAAGTFYVDWGDGNKERIKISDARNNSISHTYSGAANTYEIKLGGKATKYSSTETLAAVSFYVKSNTSTPLSSMHGCLGCVFSTIDDETVPLNQRQPRFFETFKDSTSLAGELSSDLFDGIHGVPVSSMFYRTFYGCGKLTGAIPDKLFAGLDGEPVQGVFSQTFRNCSKLSGSIPEKLFAGIKGQPADGMFESTFDGCSGLTDRIPDDLFAGITPNNSYADNSFANTFYGCTKLTGYSPKINGQYLYEIWTPTSNQNTYTNDTKLSDYDCIPKVWGGGGTKNPGECD